MREVQQEVDADEYAEWLVYETFYPPAEERAVCCLERLTLLLATFMQGGKGAVRPEELFPYMRVTQKPKTPEQMERELKAWARGLQKRTRRRREGRLTNG